MARRNTVEAPVEEQTPQAEAQVATEPQTKSSEKVSVVKEHRIKLLANDNPKREGTKAHARFELYRDGMTVAEFLQAGGSPTDIRWDVKHGYIETFLAS